MATTKSKKIEDASVDNTDNEKEGEKEMNNGTVIANGINGNGYSNGNGYMLSNMKPIELGMEAFESLTPEKLMEIVVPRLSRIRTKAELVSRIRSGKIKIGQPSTMMNWTFKNVVVKDVSISSRGTKDAKVELSREQFDALTNEQKAELIEKHTRERRAAEEIFPALLRLGLKLSAYDTVYLTCGRISIEGIVIEGHSRKQVALVDGVEFE